MFWLVCISVSGFLRDVHSSYVAFNCKFSCMFFLYNPAKASFIIAKSIISLTSNQLRSAITLTSPYLHFTNPRHACTSLLILWFKLCCSSLLFDKMSDSINCFRVWYDTCLSKFFWRVGCSKCSPITILSSLYRSFLSIFDYCKLLLIFIIVFNYCWLLSLL